MARVILDGYNLLLGSGQGAGDADRERLVREAARYRGERAVEILIVFDSRSGGGAAQATGRNGVRVEFARGDADAHILEIVRRSRSPRDLLVVTSDRRLAEQARDLGARTEDAVAFRRRAATRSAPSRHAGLGPKLAPEDVAAWEQTFRSRKSDDDF